MYSEKPSNAYKYVCGCSSKKKAARDEKRQKLNQYWGKKCILQKWLPAVSLFTVCSLLFATEQQHRQQNVATSFGIIFKCKGKLPTTASTGPSTCLTFLCNKHTFNYQQPENPSSTSVIKWPRVFWWASWGRILGNSWRVQHQIV